MIKVIVALRDTKLDAYLDPVCVPTTGVAVRELQSVVSKGEGPVAQYPDDFEFWLLGSFDSESGYLESKASKILDVRSLASKA